MMLMEAERVLIDYLLPHIITADKENCMSNPNSHPQGFDFYPYRTVPALGGAATAIVGELCFDGAVKNIGDALFTLVGLQVA